ncbi:MAG: hypothetical protein ACOYUZ_00315 [Patescibacteria group bacterium]
MSSHILWRNCGKRFLFALTGFFVLFLVTFALGAKANAATCSFSATEPTNDWNTAANWDCGYVPTISDNIVIPAGTSTNLTADAWVNHGTVNAGATVNAGSYSLRFNDYLFVIAGAMVTSTSGDITVVGTLQNGGSFGTESGDLWFDATTSNVGAGAVLDFGSGTVTFYTGAVLENSGTINAGSATVDFTEDIDNTGGTINGDTAIFQIQKSWSPAGTFNAGQSEVILTGSGATQYIPALTFYDLTINKSSGSAFLSGNATATNDFTQTNGGFYYQNYQLALAGDYSVSSGGGYNTNAELRLYGTADQTLGSIYMNLPSVTVDKPSGSVTLLSDAAIGSFAGTLTVFQGVFNIGGETLDIYQLSAVLPGGTVTSTNGTITFNGGVTSTGSIGTESGSLNFYGTTTNNGLIDPGISGSIVTYYGTTTNNGTINQTAASSDIVFQGPFTNNGTFISNGDVSFYDLWTNAGTFTAGSGSSVYFLGSLSGQYIPSVTFVNLTINKTGGSAYLNGTATTTGEVTVANGIFNLNNYTLHVAGDWTNSGGSVSDGGPNALVDFYGTADQYVANETNFPDVITTKSVGTIYANSVVVQGDFTTTVGGKWDVQASTFQVNGATNIYAGTYVTSTSGIMNFVGAVSSSGAFGTSGGTLNFVSTSTNNYIIEIGTGTAHFYSDFVNNGALNGDKGTIIIEGAWSPVGVFAEGTSEVSYQGSANQTIPAMTFYDLTINKTGATNNVYFSGHVTTTNDFNLSRGRCYPNSNWLSIGGNWTRSFAQGAFFGSGSTVEFYGTGNNTIAYGQFDNLIMSKPSGILSSSVAFSAAGTFTTYGGGTFSMIGNFQADGVSTIGAGTTVTSTNGAITFAGYVTSSGNIGTNTGLITFSSGFTNNGSAYANNFNMSGDVWNYGTFTIASGNATSSGDFYNPGTFNLGSGVFAFAGDLNGTGGTETSSNGTLRLTGAGSQNMIGFVPAGTFNLQSLKSGGTVTTGGDFYISGTLEMLGGGGTLDMAGNTLGVTGAASISPGDTVTTTGGLLKFDGGMNNAGSLGAASGDMLFASLINSGTLDIGSGTVTSTGITTSTGAINGGTGILVIMDDFISTGGVFNCQSGTVRYTGTGSQILAGVAYNNLEIRKPAGTAASASDAGVLGNLYVYDGTLGMENFGLTVTGTVMVDSGAVLASLAGDFVFFGAVSSTGTLETQTGSMDFSGTFVNNGIFNPGSAGLTITHNATTTNNGTINQTATSSHIIYNDDLINNGTINTNGKLTFNDGFANNGTFTAQGSNQTVFGAALDQMIPGIVMDNFMINKTGGTASLGGNVSSTASFSNSASSTFAVGNYIFYASGTYANSGLITRGATGSIKHAAESVRFTDSAGTDVATYTTPADGYITLSDANLNMDGSVADTVAFTVTSNGGDSENITLTETGPATGIFRNATKFPIISLAYVAPGDSAISITTNSIGQANYTDPQDTGDAASDTASLVYTAGAGGGGSGGGGGGGGSTAPANPTFQIYDSGLDGRLQNLEDIGVAIHALVKLPDDGDTATQADSAVYYVGADGKRHAFPNAKVYFTWYTDFSGVSEINLEKLASMPLGANVTYKPGVRMVKFITDPKVYVVSKGGVLHWVTTEEAAIALYGINWNNNVDDISDAFYMNYKFDKPDIAGISDYDPAKHRASVMYPSDSLMP